MKYPTRYTNFYLIRKNIDGVIRISLRILTYSHVFSRIPHVFLTFSHVFSRISHVFSRILTYSHVLTSRFLTFSSRIYNIFLTYCVVSKLPPKPKTLKLPPKPKFPAKTPNCSKLPPKLKTPAKTFFFKFLKRI